MAVRNLPRMGIRLVAAQAASSVALIPCPARHAIGPKEVAQPPPCGSCSTSGVRGFSEDLRIVAASISEEQYHHAADETLDSMADAFEAYVEDNDIAGDIEYSQGVLTVNLGKHGTFVINKQTPNRQIWLSSPVSGPFRYDFQHGRWIYHRDNRDLVHQLQQEVEQLIGKAIKLES